MLRNYQRLGKMREVEMMTVEEINKVRTYYACISPDDYDESGLGTVCDMACRVPELEARIAQLEEGMAVACDLNDRQAKRIAELEAQVKKMEQPAPLVPFVYAGTGRRSEIEFVEGDADVGAFPCYVLHDGDPEKLEAQVERMREALEANKELVKVLTGADDEIANFTIKLAEEVLASLPDTSKTVEKVIHINKEK